MRSSALLFSLKKMVMEYTIDGIVHKHGQDVGAVANTMVVKYGEDGGL